MIAIFKSPNKYFFLSGLIAFLITAYFSEGYYHPDEHFQILEFCNYKLGLSPAADLPWEYHERIRPALQPALAFLIIKIINFFGVSNPFTWAFFLRIISALLSWFVVSNTALFLLKDFSTRHSKKIFLLLSFFLWFIPFLSVRYSSETYASLTFLSAVCLLMRYHDVKADRKPYPLVFAGLLLGLSFFFRFQMGFVILGLGLWLIFIKKEYWKNLMIMAASGLCSIVFCICIDCWFYGNFELTPLNYFFTNIIENKAADWGTFPWWSYFTFFIIQAIPPISLFLVVFFFAGLYKRPTNIFTWCLIPFLIGHFVVGHKEMRFMFPMVFSFIYIVSLGIDDFILSKKYLKAGRIILITLLMINAPLLIVRSILPAQEAIPYYKFLYDYTLKNKATLLCPEKNIYELVGVKVNFYQSPNLICLVMQDESEISNYLKTHQPDSIFLLQRNLSDITAFEGYNNELVYCLFPKWLLRNNMNDWQSRARIWKIQELRKIE